MKHKGDQRELNCDVCGSSFVPKDCSSCRQYGKNCNGVPSDEIMCQECCASDLESFIRDNPVGFVLAESA